MFAIQLDEQVLKTMIQDAVKDLAPASAAWPERIWTVPAETRLSVEDVAAVVGRTKAFVYRHTRNKTIAFKRLDGELVFRAADVRQFIQDREEAA